MLSIMTSCKAEAVYAGHVDSHKVRHLILHSFHFLEGKGYLVILHNR